MKIKQFSHNHITMIQMLPRAMTFQHPFSMVVSGPKYSWKWNDLKTVAFLAYIITSRMDLTVFLRTQPLYEDLQKIIESMHGIPNYLDNSKFIDPGKRNLNSFDDPMTEANCQR